MMTPEQERNASADALYDEAIRVWSDAFRASTIPGYYERSYAPPVVARLLKKSAEKGHVKAQYEYASILQTGVGVAKSESEAIKWFTKAAFSGDRKSQSSLGAAYEKGQGVKTSFTEAYAWYALAAHKGREDFYWKEYYLKPLVNLRKDLLPLSLENADNRFRELLRITAAHLD